VTPTNGHGAGGRPPSPAPDTLAAEWQAFAAACLPHAGPVRRRKMQIAFYAGARGAFALLARVADGGRPALERLVAEGDEFARRVASGEE
jgi:predicted secreted protein